jgi:pilus assembly protein CpaB
MKQSQWVFLATFLGGTAVFHLYARQLEKEARGGSPQQILLVTQDLSPGSVLSEENVGVMTMPSDYLDGRRISGKDRPQLLGATIGQRLEAGDQLAWSDLAEGTGARQLSQLIAPGMRAYSLSSDANPFGLLLRATDHVDVLLDVRGESKTLLTRILVLSVGGQFPGAESTTSPSSRSLGVTLSVTPEQAGRLLRAEREGRLRVVLRNPEDFSTQADTADSESSGKRLVQSVKWDGTQEIEHVR